MEWCDDVSARFRGSQFLGSLCGSDWMGLSGGEEENDLGRGIRLVGV